MTTTLLPHFNDILQYICLLYTSDAADDMQCVDLGGRRIIKKNFFQAEDGIRDPEMSRGLGDVYKRQYIFHVEKAKDKTKQK